MAFKYFNIQPRLSTGYGNGYSDGYGAGECHLKNIKRAVRGDNYDAN